MNVTYSYAIIASAATAAQEIDEWKNKEKVQNLMFSNKCVKAFLDRGGLTRRKITREDKDIPDDNVVSNTLKIGQDLYVQNQHSPRTCWNFDETAFTWAIGPSYMYCPGNQQRASNIGISNTKLRITAVIAVNALGEFAPLMLIIKHSVSSEKRPDQSGMTVIKEFFKKPGFTANDGWELKLWGKVLTINNITAQHKVIYMIHKESGHVITSQVKAWNDSVRMILWFEVVMLPLKEKLGKMLLWCDNCGSHKTSVVKDVIEEIGIDVAFLPPNMTSELQVLDLVVNGPLKAHIRTRRANRLCKAFQEYKIIRADDNTLDKDKRLNPNFDPPKPTMIEGVQDLILLFKSQFNEEKLKSCINRTFIRTGTLTIEGSAPASFFQHKKVTLCGTMRVVPKGTTEVEMEESLDEEESVELALFLYFVTHNSSTIDNEVNDSDNET